MKSRLLPRRTQFAKNNQMHGAWRAMILNYVNDLANAMWDRLKKREKTQRQIHGHCLIHFLGVTQMRDCAKKRFVDRLVKRRRLLKAVTSLRPAGAIYPADILNRTWMVSSECVPTAKYNFTDDSLRTAWSVIVKTWKEAKIIGEMAPWSCITQRAMWPERVRSFEN